jgi:hypothetical protein
MLMARMTALLMGMAHGNWSKSMIRATGLTGWASGASGKGKKDAMFESDRSISVVMD